MTPRQRELVIQGLRLLREKALDAVNEPINRRMSRQTGILAAAEEATTLRARVREIEELIQSLEG